MSTYFVVRDTNHPEEDLTRNFSSVLGGWDCELAGRVFATEEDAAQAWNDWNGGEEYAEKREFLFHPRHNSFVPVHYHGLGAWALNADTVEDAIKEAAAFSDDLACASESGDGHFYAEDVVSFHKVREGKYIFEIKY